MQRVVGWVQLHVADNLLFSCLTRDIQIDVDIYAVGKEENERANTRK